MRAPESLIETREGRSLKDFTSFKIGGRLKHFFVAHDLKSLRLIIRKSFSLGNKLYLLGLGSNLLASDNDIKVAVIKLGKEFSFIKRLDSDTVELGSATPLSLALSYCLREKLSGLERMAGIPASIGGMVATNASSFGKSIGSCVEEVTVSDYNGQLKNLSKDQIDFGYHYSSLKECIILKVKLKLSRNNNIRQDLSYYLQQRLASQDFSYPSAGCIFKNPQSATAAFLIQDCKLKGFNLGDAFVSQKHSNFIINKGRAKARDVANLIDFIKEKVHKKFGLLLEEEIIRWEI